MIDKYFNEIIITNKNKLNSNKKIMYLVEKSIENFNSYSYFMKKYMNLSKIQNSAIEDFVCYFSFIFESFVNDLVIYNKQALLITQRVLLELYFKFIFIIKSDDYVSKLFLDFRYVSIYNIAKLENTMQKLSCDEQEKISEKYFEILQKYNLDSNSEYGDDYWIKIAMEYLNVEHPSKTISNLIDYLINKEYIEEIFKSEYKSCCDFIHSNQNAFGITQCINIDNDDYKYVNGAIKDFNYIIYLILKELNKNIDSKLIDYVVIVENILNDILEYQ